PTQGGFIPPIGGWRNLRLSPEDFYLLLVTSYFLLLTCLRDFSSAIEQTLTVLTVYPQADLPRASARGLL
ncbi:MAG TPA: hypothetical protein VKD08_15130, partial [Ignavibacteriaceae bacterium]|nr:hypothetical protein [Ignavibacteriaceae bacterium]